MFMKGKFPIPFVKMSGAGNDFIIIDHREQIIDQTEKAALAKQICRRRFSIGADGLTFIESSDKFDFKWDFYNSDGSVAEMCGNGARCAARFAVENGIAGRKLSFETIAGVIKAEVCEDESVRIGMTDPFDFKKGEAVSFDGNEHQLFFVNTGVPHAVIFVEDNCAPVDKWGSIVRYHEQFQPNGTNANFVSKLADGRYSSRTYERGVEEETRACGTGAVASALYIAINGLSQSPIKIVTSGGDELSISFELVGDTAAKNVVMQGAARIIYEGNLTAESIL